MSNTLSGGWGKPVASLGKSRGINAGLHTTTTTPPAPLVDNHPPLYSVILMLIPQLIHGFSRLISSVRYVVIPIIHTAYNKHDKVFLNFIIVNYRRCV